MIVSFSPPLKKTKQQLEEKADTIEVIEIKDEEDDDDEATDREEDAALPSSSAQPPAHPARPER